jgi:hypothetical protein
MKQITLQISEEAYKKLSTQTTVKRLLGNEFMSMADVFLSKVITAMDADEAVVTMRTRKEVHQDGSPTTGC